MTDLTSLTGLLAQAEQRRDEALAEQMHARAAHGAALTQAEQLVAYRKEYEQRWSAQFCQEGRIELVRCYQGFVERLTQAVDHQVRIAGQAAARVEQATASVLAHELRTASVKQLIERRTLELLRAAERRDQLQTDEFAARAAWGRTGTLHRPLAP